MVCNICQLKKKRDLEYIRELANKFVSLQEESVQIYSEYNSIIKDTIYDFEPINSSRGNIIQIIKYND